MYSIKNLEKEEISNVEFFSIKAFLKLNENIFNLSGYEEIYQ